VPAGYHVEEVARHGLVTAGLVLVLVPYGIGAIGALAAEGDNASTWLYLPVAGPWMMLGRREYGTCTNPGAKESAGCVGDVFLVTGLIMDGVIQAAGATLLLVGYLAPKSELVRDEQAVRLSPTRVGSGYGLGLSGTF
jgi:hypothetical protein